jgi:hypothetical protein
MITSNFCFSARCFQLWRCCLDYNAAVGDICVFVSKYFAPILTLLVSMQASLHTNLCSWAILLHKKVNHKALAKGFTTDNYLWLWIGGTVVVYMRRTYFYYAADSCHSRYYIPWSTSQICVMRLFSWLLVWPLYIDPSTRTDGNI